MFQEQRRYYCVLTEDFGLSDDQESDLGKNEFGYVYRIIIELTPCRWEHGVAMQVRVIKLVETEDHKHHAYRYYQRWFYDKDFEGPVRTLMTALANGEVIARTATNAVSDIFWVTLKQQNYVAKFAPKYWANWVKLVKASETDFPKPSENPDDWGKPELIRQPYDEITGGR